MAMRLQEIHPSLVHYPLAFLPLAVGADLVGRATGSRPLREMGRIGMALAAGSAALAAVAGLAAQEEVNVEEGGHAYDMLVTHRNLNIGVLAATSAMAAWRWSRDEAGPGYLAAGLAALGTVGFSAYLGGKMVYEHGLGVAAADGLYEEPHPVVEITRETAGEALRYAGRDVAEGARSAVRQLRQGEIAPYFTRHASGEGRGAANGDGGTAAADDAAQGTSAGPNG